MAAAKKGMLDKAKDAIVNAKDAVAEFLDPTPVKRKPLKRATAAKKATAKKASVKKAAVKKTTHSMDKKLIALSQDYEVRDWCKSFKCTEAELRAAVNVVGRSSAKVRAHLKGV